MGDEQFVYVIYIASTPEKVWTALLDSEMTWQYWGRENVSDWKVGSKWEEGRFDGARTINLVGEVIESLPPRRLVLSWAEPADGPNRAKHTRVAIEIEPVDNMVRLTVTHNEFQPGSDMLRKISNGWPRVLSSLKS